MFLLLSFTVTRISGSEKKKWDWKEREALNFQLNGMQQWT